MAGIGREYKIPLNGRWVVFTDAKLRELRKTGNGDDAEALFMLHAEFERNRLAYFLAHGVPWRQKTLTLGDGVVRIPAAKYPEAWGNDGTAFLNDSENGICMVVSPSKVGKTYVGAAWTLLRCIPCDESWPVFRQHGIRHIEWTGPKLVRLFSFSLTNVADMWKRYRELIPRHELGPYAPGWGRGAGEKGKSRVLNFGDGKPKDVELSCGTVLTFNSYSQPEAVTESYESDLAHFDEQSDKQTWLGWLRSITVRPGVPQCCHTMTGRVLKDRPDTGAGGWIKRDIWDAPDDTAFGMSVGKYYLSVDSVPDALISVAVKKRLYDQWANPHVKRSLQDRRAGIARYWGGWEPSGGLVIPEWDASVHLIDPFDIPKFWTRYRMCDHGHNPCAALWAAVSPGGDAFLYREYYESGNDIGQNAAGIVEASGNKRNLVGTIEDSNGVAWPLYEETHGGEEYMRSEMDAWSFGSKAQGGLTIGQMYQRFGLWVSAASTRRTEEMIPVMRQWFVVDQARRHARTNELGAPRVYVFNTLRNFIWEITGWSEVSTPSGKIKPADKDDHLMSCFRFFVARDPVYYGVDTSGEVRKQPKEKGVVDEPDPGKNKQANRWGGY